MVQVRAEGGARELDNNIDQRARSVATLQFWPPHTDSLSHTTITDYSLVISENKSKHSLIIAKLSPW